jgi:hypothetical protein
LHCYGHSGCCAGRLSIPRKRAALGPAVTSGIRDIPEYPVRECLPDIDKELEAAKRKWADQKGICDVELAGLERGAFYTRWSTRKAVILIQGPPDHEETNQLRYGIAQVNLVGDHVISWSNNLFSAVGKALETAPLLKAKDLDCDGSMVRPYGADLTGLDSFTVSTMIVGLITTRLEQGFDFDSTKFNVEMSQARPAREDRTPACSGLPACDVALVYGQAEVLIGRDRVIGWRDPAGQLRVTKMK